MQEVKTIAGHFIKRVVEFALVNFLGRIDLCDHHQGRKGTFVPLKRKEM